MITATYGVVSTVPRVNQSPRQLPERPTTTRDQILDDPGVLVSSSAQSDMLESTPFFAVQLYANTRLDYLQERLLSVQKRFPNARILRVQDDALHHLCIGRWESHEDASEWLKAHPCKGFVKRITPQ